MEYDDYESIDDDEFIGYILEDDMELYEILRDDWEDTCPISTETLGLTNRDFF